MLFSGFKVSLFGNTFSKDLLKPIYQFHSFSIIGQIKISYLFELISKDS
jgi:hypothetical protein